MTLRVAFMLLALPSILSFAPPLSPLLTPRGLSATSTLPHTGTRRSVQAQGFRMGNGEAPPASRRDAFAQLLAFGAVVAAPNLVEAAGQGPEITAKVYFDFKLVGRTKALENAKWEKIIARDKRAAGGSGQDTVGRIVIGLYGKEAPESVGTILKLVKGELPAECIDEDEAYDEEAFGQSDRDRLTKRQIYKQCKAKEGTNLSYQYSQVGTVIKGKRIDVGRMNKLYLAAPQNEDSNSLKHDSEGVVSVRKGGGAFEFTIAPGPNPELDKTNTVVGRVLEGAEMVEVLNDAPVSQGQFLEGAFKFTANVIGDVRGRSTA
eukprot:CAMPEP_0172088836 /NCGR_PEP_ID=MMETSP1043-20130122/23460_1 /TAXON_ID=464988 /ORGANISM="Hemiselmis andersenii, Strain CCMP441" /LENGTH=318 /DNA_ID=CAMNT_0012751195 /DNA_START=1 /DNA_END=953 /DNA_ORIENTATION=+